MLLHNKNVMLEPTITYFKVFDSVCWAQIPHEKIFS
jgi:hypothetical protein